MCERRGRPKLRRSYLLCSYNPAILTLGLLGMHERIPAPGCVLAYEPTADLHPLPSHLFLQAHITGIADNEVIKQCDIKKLPGIYELLRNLVIFRTWIGV